jgi:ABC-type branched-subunit amino acid transport system ATPase component
MSLIVKDLRSGYGQTIVLWDVSFQVRSGSITALLGLNGAGKTTLLKTIMGVLPVQQGDVLFNDQSLKGLDPYKIARNKIAYAPQDAALFPDLTTEENLRVAFRKNGQDFEKAFNSAIEYFPVLAERRNQKAGTLSGGEQKMLFFARALLVSPDLILLDEITEGLQPSVIERVQKAMKGINEVTKTTIFLVEQHISFALSIADHFLVMRQGKIVAQGDANEENIKERIEQVLSL